MKLIMHRGLHNKIVNENTYKAIKNALLDNRVYGVEFDIRMTKDKKIVLLHDSLINRTSNGSGLVLNKTLKELKKYNFGNKNYYQTIPTLEGILTLVKTKKLFLIELKDNGSVFINELIDILNRNKDKKIYLMSFNEDVMNKINYKHKGIIKMILLNTNIKNYKVYFKM